MLSLAHGIRREHVLTVVSSVILRTSLPSEDFHFTQYRACGVRPRSDKAFEENRADLGWRLGVEGLCCVLEFLPGMDVDHRSIGRQERKQRQTKLDQVSDVPTIAC